MAERIGTATRCHLLGVVVSTTLVAMTVWLWTDPAFFLRDSKHAPDELRESTRLISSRSTVQNQYAAARRKRDRAEVLIQEVRSWLPEEHSWSAFQTSIRRMANRCGLQIHTLQSGNEHIGSRVQVLDVHCELEGDYIDVCRFLEMLSQAERPIWCDELRLHREDGDGASSSTGTCVAVLSFRAPSAGSGTTAAKLFNMETQQ